MSDTSMASGAHPTCPDETVRMWDSLDAHEQAPSAMVRQHSDLSQLARTTDRLTVPNGAHTAVGYFALVAPPPPAGTGAGAGAGVAVASFGASYTQRTPVM